MKLLHIALASTLALNLAAPAFAQDAQANPTPTPIADSARAEAQATPPAMTPHGGSKILTGAGAALFAGGLGVALYGFINDKNGKFSEFGEAHSSNKHLGAAGISMAFGGGALMFLSSHLGRYAPDVQAGPGSLSVSKRVSW
jgi:hypothetical protein